jgi:hypothetical protein
LVVKKADGITSKQKVGKTMPYHVEKQSGKRPWKIVKEGGKVVGSSTSKAKANASVKARYASENNKRGWGE